MPHEHGVLSCHNVSRNSGAGYTSSSMILSILNHSSSSESSKTLIAVPYSCCPNIPCSASRQMYAAHCSANCTALMPSLSRSTSACLPQVAPISSKLSSVQTGFGTGSPEPSHYLLSFALLEDDIYQPDQTAINNILTHLRLEAGRIALDANRNIDTKRHVYEWLVNDDRSLLPVTDLL
jgi:hypothetical protein